MKITITINMDNAAFQDRGELLRILDTAVFGYEDRWRCLEPDATLESYRQGLRDINGNTVGEVVFEGDE